MLVAVEGEKPVPKVIDFGVAKATEQKLTERTLFTEQGQLIGTPEYMSPEQAEMTALDIDTRTDIYSLGVLLYELLVGALPFDPTSLRQAGFAEIQRIIREEEPPKPSTRLSSLGDDSAHAAKKRRTDPSTLAKQLRGDLDCITMRAIDKDRTRRYETANGLALDIQRYLDEEPVLARPPSTAYRVRKFIRKNRGPVGVAAVCTVSVLVALFVSVTFWQRAAEDRDNLKAAEAEIIAERDAANEAREAAEAHREGALQLLRELRSARHMYEWEVYVANIRAAQIALSHNEISEVFRRLDATPQALRNWEWNYLRSRSDLSLAVMEEHEDPILTAVFSPDSTYLLYEASADARGLDKLHVHVCDAATGSLLSALTSYGRRSRGYSDRSSSPAFSADGKRLAYLSDSETVCIVETSTGQQIAIFKIREGDRLVSMAFSPNGNRLALLSVKIEYLVRDGEGDRTILKSAESALCLWDANSREQLANRQWENYNPNVPAALIFSPDSKLLGFAEENTVFILDATNGQNLDVLRGHRGSVSSLAFSPDGTRLASGGRDSTIRIWNVVTADELGVLQCPEDLVVSLMFSADGSRLASRTSDQTMRIWSIPAQELVAVTPTLQEHVWSMAFSRDGKHLACAGKSTARSWNASTGVELATLRGCEFIYSTVACAPNARLLAAAADDHAIRILDTSSGRHFDLRGHRYPPYAVTFSPDNRFLASVSEKSVRIWNASAIDPFVLRGHEGEVVTLSFSREGTHLVSGSSDKTVRVWDPLTGKELVALQLGEVPSLAVDPNGPRVAVGSRDGAMRVWDLQTGRQLLELKHPEAVDTVAFSPDGLRIASGADDHVVRIWDATTGDQSTVCRGHDDYIWSLAFSPDGTRLASAANDGSVRLWNVSIDRRAPVVRAGALRYEVVMCEPATLLGHQGAVYSVVFSPDGSMIASAGEDKTIRLWQVSTGLQSSVPTMRGHEASLSSVVFSPDGRRLASGSWDSTVRVWDTTTGDELVVLRGHEAPVRSVTFSPDGSRLASSSNDGTIRVWDSTPYRTRHQELQEFLQGPVPN